MPLLFIQFDRRVKLVSVIKRINCITFTKSANTSVHFAAPPSKNVSFSI